MSEQLFEQEPDYLRNRLSELPEIYKNDPGVNQELWNEFIDITVFNETTETTEGFNARKKRLNELFGKSAQLIRSHPELSKGGLELSNLSRFYLELYKEYYLLDQYLIDEQPSFRVTGF